MRWHWLMKLYRFQTYSSETTSVCCIVCPPPKVKSSLSVHLTPCLLYCPSTFSPVQTLITIVSMIFCLFAVLVHVLLSVLYPTYEWSPTILDFFFLTSLKHDILKIRPCCGKWPYFICSYGWVDTVSVYHTVFIQASTEGHRFFPCLGHCGQCCNEQRSAYMFRDKCFHIFRVGTQKRGCLFYLYFF